jgi:hypothetical protein
MNELPVLVKCEDNVSQFLLSTLTITDSFVSHLPVDEDLVFSGTKWKGRKTQDKNKVRRRTSKEN